MLIATFSNPTILTTILISTITTLFIIILHHLQNVHLSSDFETFKLLSLFILSSSGPGQVHVNSKSLNIKVYFKSLRDLDLELEAIIAMFHHHHHKTFLNRITLKSLLV